MRVVLANRLCVQEAGLPSPLLAQVKWADRLCSVRLTPPTLMSGGESTGIRPRAPGEVAGVHVYPVGLAAERAFPPR